MTQPEPFPKKGTHYYAIVSMSDDDVPHFLTAFAYDPDPQGPKGVVFKQFRLDNDSHRWIEDPHLMTYFLGQGDSWVPRSLSDEQAAKMASDFGGKLMDPPPA